MRRVMEAFLWATAVIAGGSSMLAAQAASPVVVVVETDKGTIEITLEAARAPVTVANFLRYVDAGRYDGGVFHRTVRPDTETRSDYPIQVIQARRAAGTPAFPAIALERTRDTGLKHQDGAVSMARAAPLASATSDFFICIGDQPELDAGGRRREDGEGFAVFGHVSRGMDVVRAIQASPVAPSQTGAGGRSNAVQNSQTLRPPIEIVSIRRK